MNKKANNYLVIIIVLLLVVAIITGAGLCYLSWPEEGVGSSEFVSGSSELSSEALEGAKEEGRQEVLAGIREELDAEVSAEDILNGLLGNLGETSAESNTASTETMPGTEGSESTTETTSSESVNQSSEGAEQGTEGTVQGSEGTAQPGESLSTNKITMADIKVTDAGEYEYWKDGQLASKKGIDVSKYQGQIDWSKAAKDGIEYAFIRVGCRGYGSKGSLMQDEYFHQNMKGALAQNVQVGAYFFSQALNVQEAEAEAEFVLQELEGYEITYPVAIDIEKVDGQKARQDALTKAERTEVCIAFCEKIKAAGYIPMVYGDLETFSELLDAEQLAGYDFWICETDGDMTFPYEFAVWQYSHEGSVSGIKGDTSISISVKEW